MQNIGTLGLARAADQREAPRFDTALPVRIDGVQGRAFNISEHGIYFETDVPQQLGALVNFTLEFHLYGKTHQMVCEAKVVRVEEQGARIGVGARLLAPFFSGEEVTEAVPLPDPQLQGRGRRLDS
ncbi:MAG: hypothetical protein JWP65_1684 [Ramlibacter sp.]|jgi:hypothetical protein|uniref:PilZ domain-containing protein n=1 Tax=Ramlibacter sp. TaxID=1917967 RepID=UPI0026335F3F|nr:PilZ domain-containing protein [Ramlibacter sp.]MDB5751263.1 hypothetical protein [Ramlibacter sp.]